MLFHIKQFPMLHMSIYGPDKDVHHKIESAIEVSGK